LLPAPYHLFKNITVILGILLKWRRWCCGWVFEVQWRCGPW